ncbi:MAG: hypothetical protein LUE27_00305 [Clostridia bacterium]|nr:hypothetical protein [Clostridia bacterium]
MLGSPKEKEGSYTFLNIKDGAIVKRTPQGEERYTFVEGELTGITKRERTFHGEVVLYWYLVLHDKTSPETYLLGFPYGSNVFKSLILQVASPEGMSSVKLGIPIKIKPYTKDGFDKVQVITNGKKLSWVTTELPPVRSMQIGEKVVRDDTERMRLICGYCKTIAESIPILDRYEYNREGE